MRAPKVLLFDLGGVLVETGGPGELLSLLGGSVALEDMRHRWLNSQTVAQFETGRCTTEEFTSRFIAEWALRLEPDEFLARFRAWARAPYPGIPDLLAGLRVRHVLACLSNTNAVHWEKILGMEGLQPVLERPFASHQLGLMKPTAEVYAHVVRELGCRPDEIAFFDDGPENVNAAAEAGLSAHLTAGPAQLRAALVDLGVL
jgi:HAD superfamily hydrolase (TIGR01509 family)